MNVKGNTVPADDAEQQGFQQLLMGINQAIDMDNIIRSVGWRYGYRDAFAYR